MRKWSIKGFAIAGMVVGIIGLLSRMVQPGYDIFSVPTYTEVVRTLTPAALLALVAWVQNLFAKGNGAPSD